MSRMSASALTQLRIRHLKLIESLVSVGSLHKAAIPNFSSHQSAER